MTHQQLRAVAAAIVSLLEKVPHHRGSPQALANELGLRRRDVEKAIAALVKDGWATTPRDRMSVTLTAKSLAVLAEGRARLETEGLPAA